MAADSRYTTPMTAIALTPEQHRAVHAVEQSVGIVANAGSGKTRVLVERVAHILETTDTPLRRILLVTFTEKAARELKDRLMARLPERRLELITASITTFHGFATRVLREHAPALGISPSFRIAGEGEAAALLHRAIEEGVLQSLRTGDPDVTMLCQRFPFRTIVREMAPLLEDRWSFEQYILTVRGEPVEPVRDAIISVFQKCNDRYRSLKKTDDLLDFHDLEILCWQLFSNDPKILSDYQRQFRHLLVDEFQDTNPLQAAIVRQLFTPPDNILCVVGDPKQSIYRFRRAEVGCFAQMLTTIAEAGGETVTLTHNFRSSAGVVEFVNRVCGAMPHYTPLVGQSDSQDDGSIITIPVPTTADHATQECREMEAHTVADALPDLAATSGGYGNLACLFLTRSTLQLWADTLRAAGIPIHVHNSGGYWERAEVRALLLCLQVIIGLQTRHPDDQHLLALLLSPLFSLSLDDIYRLRHIHPFPTTGELPPLHRAVFANSDVGAQMRRWCEAAALRTADEVMAMVMTDTQYLRRLSDRDPSGQQAANAEAFLRLLQEMGQTTARPLPHVLDQVMALRDRSRRTPDTPATLTHDDAVQLMTIHAAKGNEFPVVIIPDLFRKPNTQTPQWLFEPALGFAVRYDDDFDPKAADTAEWQAIRDQYIADSLCERDRLLYVALTRAKQKLVLPLHPHMKEIQKGRAIWHDILRQ